MFKRILWLGLAVIFIGIPLYLGLYFFYPDMAPLKKENPPKTAFMEYREAEWRRQGKEIAIRQKWVKPSRISPFLIKAVIISEDDKFWHHEGFDYEALQKAIEEDLRKKNFKVGGSTISQQLAKNLYLSPSKNPIRKMKEAILTWRLEKALSKKRIIELYLNVAEWGEGIFGIEAASRHYFGKPASALSAREASRLAAVLPNPRLYDPLGSSKYVRRRSERIYRIMIRRGIVIPEYEAVMKEPEEALPEAPAPGENLPSMTDPEENKTEKMKESSPESETDPGLKPTGEISPSAVTGEEGMEPGKKEDP